MFLCNTGINPVLYIYAIYMCLSLHVVHTHYIYVYIVCTHRIYSSQNVTHGSPFIHSTIKRFRRTTVIFAVLESGKLRSIENSSCFKKFPVLERPQTYTQIRGLKYYRTSNGSLYGAP